MKKLLWIVVLSIIAGCTTLAPTPLPTEKPVEQMTPMEKAQVSINEANVAITAAAMTLEQDYKDGLLTYEVYDKLGDTLVDYAHRVDYAQAMLRNGQEIAITQADSLRDLTKEFLRELRLKRKKPATYTPPQLSPDMVLI